jgi:hypothetical protein
MSRYRQTELVTLSPSSYSGVLQNTADKKEPTEVESLRIRPLFLLLEQMKVTSWKCLFFLFPFDI